jgi:hypothetical protein
MSVTAPPSVQPQDGVIKDARQRRSHRRRRATIALLLLGGLAAAGWLLDGGSSKALTSAPPRPTTAATEATEQPSFNVRLYPAFEVGQASYCFANIEHGVTGSSACGAAPVSSTPLVMVQGYGEPHSGHWTTVAVTLPDVTTLLVDGNRRVPTSTLPGLPYGLRAARIVTTKHELRPPALRDRPFEAGPTLVPLNAAGQRLPEHVLHTDQQAHVASWGQPSRPLYGSSGAKHAPHGACELQTNGLRGLRAIGGEVATGIHAFPGMIVGEAFMPCIETRYLLGGEPVRALVLLNAANPSAPAGALPNFRPVPGEKGFYTEGGALTATRAGNDWLVVGQGSSPKQRLQVLRHLRAPIRL